MKTNLIVCALLFALLSSSSGYCLQKHTVDVKKHDKNTSWDNDSDIHMFDFEFGNLKIPADTNVFTVDCPHEGIWVKNYNGELPKGIGRRYFHITSDGTLIFAKIRPTIEDKPEKGTAEQLVQDANAVYDTRNYTDAIKLYLQAYTTFPDNRLAPYAMFMAAQCLSANMDFDKSVAMFNALIKKYPNSSSAKLSLYRVACLYAGHLGQQDRGIKLMEIFVKKFPTHALADDCLFNIAALKLIDGKQQEAVTLFKVIIDKYPNSNRAAVAKSNLKTMIKVNSEK